jgi:pimeloyl-ACP methyl ester carboxylesterase
MVVADGGTLFEVEVEALATWRFTSEDAARIRQPALSVVGEQSDPLFHEIWSLLARWMPEAEQLTIPRATHALQMMNPGAVAEGLAGFLGRHRL